MPLQASCANDGDCGAGKTCLIDGQEGGLCACLPGLAACPGDTCVDLVTDEGHCGFCDIDCGVGETCTGGVCRGTEEETQASAFGGNEGPDGPAATWDPPVLVSGGNPGASCWPNEVEAYPERAASGGAAQLFTGWNVYSYNWATQAGLTYTWNGARHWVPGGGSEGDSWAAASSRTGLNYVSMIYHSIDSYAIGIGGATPNNFTNSANWDFAIEPANGDLDPDLDDGPAIFYDDGVGNLWAVASESGGDANVCGPTSDGSDICLYLFRNCLYGAPGRSAACPLSASTPVTQSPSESHGGHATVATHPTTHDAIVAYRNAGGVKLRFFHTNIVDGSPPFKVFTVSNAAFGAARPACQTCAYSGHVPKCTGACGTDCGAEAGCAKIARKVHVVTKYDAASQRSFAYVAYDELCGGGGVYGLRLHARMDIVDVTNPNAPQLVRTWMSGECESDNQNEFMSVPALSAFSNNVGFFYYRQYANEPCLTVFSGSVDASLGLASMTNLGNISGFFPALRFASLDGFGHYLGAVRMGTPGGYLYPAWTETIPTTNAQPACPMCQGNQRYSMRIMATRVLP